MDLQKVIEVSNETLFECLIKNILSLLKWFFFFTLSVKHILSFDH
jgi:hypothetical protein